MTEPSDDFDRPPLAYPRGVTAAELQNMEFPPVAWIVTGYMAEGLAVFAGKPKVGKSWLALSIAIGVATGGVVLGSRKCAQGAVLCAALEDPPRRLKSRLKRVYGADFEANWPDTLTFWTAGDMKRLDAGGLDQLRAWIAAKPSAKLIIIDTLAKVRSGAQNRESAYEADYREVGLLKTLADETGVSMIIITHTRKAEAEDPFDTVSGTLGITGAADGTLILSRDSQGAILRATGRDVADIESAVEFDPGVCCWRELGEASAYRRSVERDAISRVLCDAAKPMTLAEIAEETGQRSGNLRRLIGKMVKAGEARKVERGVYCHPDVEPGNNGNDGNNSEGADDTL